MSENDEGDPQDLALGRVGWILLLPVVVALLLRIAGG
jgi:hypothetical protein